jgi:hypothetical protein
MSQIIYFRTEDVLPEREKVLPHIGIPKHIPAPYTSLELFSKCFDIFQQIVQPVGIIKEISIDLFEKVYQGEGLNAKDTPLQHIYPRADYLLLYALTMGKNVCEKIDSLFSIHDYAEGAMLDAIASIAADDAVNLLDEYYQPISQLMSSPKNDFIFLGYSPGYCGWHISSQRKLFELLEPEQIGITINESFLMQPIKSVSGILVGGEKNIHFFKNDFLFCDDCKSYSCLIRMRNLENSNLK